MNRFALYADKEELNSYFNSSSGLDTHFKKRYNIMPDQSISIVVNEDSGNKVISSRWGLKLSESELQYEIHLNELTKEPELSGLLKKSPCIIPISGFYKWKEHMEDPYPFFIRLINDEVTGVPGIYSEHKTSEGAKRITCAIATMPSNPLVQPLSKDMPVLFNQKQSLRWLNGESAEMAKEGIDGSSLLTDMTIFRVPELVNDPSNDSPELVQPIPKLRNEED